MKTLLRDSRIRKFYGLEAKRYGEAVIYPTAAIRRVTVLINEEANGRKVKDAFNNNALPLLNLAGLDVNVIIVKNADEMESLGKALDKPETDCVCLVGGDGTVARFITGVMKNVDHFMSSKRAPLPISIYPGGRHNNFLTRLLPNIFGMIFFCKVWRIWKCIFYLINLIKLIHFTFKNFSAIFIFLSKDLVLN